ncbi:efflux RND transporter permease subunit [bacterium]|nr:MAG: efflux RND transporter permease subunit [bacterium]
MEFNSEQNSQKKGWNWRIVNYFLSNPQITLLLFLMLVIMGIGSFFSLRVEGFPEVKVPVAIVTTVVPGAGPETVQNTVTGPLEDAFKDLKGVKDVSSSSQANFSTIVINYDDSSDLNVAVQEARTKAAAVNLPDGVQESNIFVPEVSGAPFYVSVSGGTDLITLRNDSENLKAKLLDIKGVKSFTEISGIEEKIFVELPPQFQLPQVIEQIKAANIGFPLGESVIDGKRVQVVGKSGVASLEDIRAIRINLPQVGPQAPQQVALADIAQVYLGVDYGDKVHRVGYLDKDANQFKIQPAVLYEVRLDKDADILSLNKEVEKVVHDTNSSNSKIDYAIVFNQADQSQRQVDEIIEGAVGGKWGDNPIGYVGILFGGMWLLVIGMLFFLDWRTALISTLAIPLSFLATFIVLNLAGINLNTLVLFSLVLVLGLIVDPAIVVLESIRRYVDIGYKGKAAVLRSVEVIGYGLFIAVVTSMIVFVPFGVVSGTFGEIIKYIPWTVFPALTASYFVPLIFLTWLGAKFIKPVPGAELRDEDDIHTLWPLARWFIRTNRYILKHRFIQILVIVLAFAIPIGVTAALFATNEVRQVQFAQPDDSEFLSLSIPRPTNQTYRDLLIQSTDVENILKNYSGEIKTFFYQSIDGSGDQSTMSVFIELRLLEDRDRKSPEIAKSIQNDLRAKFGEQATASEIGAGPPSGTFPVSLKIFENDSTKLAVASNRIAEELRSYPEVDFVVTDYQTQSKELVVKVDPLKAASNGLSAPAIYGQVAGLLGETTLYRLEGTDVVLRVPQDSKPATKEALLSSLVFGTNGPVALNQVAVVEESSVPSSIRSLNGERYASVSATVKDARDSINIQRKITDWAKANTATLGVNDRAFDERAGVDEFEKSFQELFLAIFLAILVSYVVFVLFFKSFVQPFIIIFAIPLILIGVFPALAFFAGGQFGFLEIIGILMVIGIAENVGIFLIDYANRKIDEGMDKNEAVAIASGIRLRAIILTKITALAGLMPLAVFSPFWRGLAVVVIFGILSSGVLSLFTTPVLYSWFTRVKKPKGVLPGEENPIALPGAVPSYDHPTNLPPNLPV